MHAYRHTDAHYWDKMKGDMEEEMADDWDVDYSSYLGYGTCHLLVPLTHSLS